MNVALRTVEINRIAAISELALAFGQRHGTFTRDVE